jgi:enamine deaminase RidA (YjgF/YER057c/UK114 family)
VTSPVSRLGSGGPYEDIYGYSRVVRSGPWVLTAGCTALVDGVVKHAGDAHAQALLAFETALSSAAQLGASAEDVVRTRMYVVGRDNADPVGRAHGAIFRDLRPASTLILVAGLLHADMLVEVEVEAFLP